MPKPKENQIGKKKSKSLESRGERGLGGSLGLSRNNRDCQFWVALKHDRQIDKRDRQEIDRDRQIDTPQTSLSLA